jgi:DNA-3-methyladenine glycosylase II
VTTRGRGGGRLDEASLARGVRLLSARDADLSGVVKRYGAPPLWSRAPGFATLVHVVLEQQVSLASARAAFERLSSVASPLTPSSLLSLDDAALRASGLSRQKAVYTRALATEILSGRLDLDALERLEDEEARRELTRVKGIGRWTADIYLLMAHGRPDIWPDGDLALAVAFQRLKNSSARPAPLELEEAAEAWRPLRAVAARILWHYYLSERAAFKSRPKLRR